MATVLFRNSNARLSLIIDAFSRCYLQPAGSSIVPQRHPSQLRLITQTAVRERSGDRNAPQINRLPLTAYTYGTKMRPRTTTPKRKPALLWAEEEDKELFRLVKEGKTTYEIHASKCFPDRSQGAISKRTSHAKRLARSLEQATEVVVHEGEQARVMLAAVAVGKGDLPFRTGYYNMASTIEIERRKIDKDDNTIFRSRNLVKNAPRKGKWTKDEDELLKQLVQRHIQIPEPALWNTVTGGKLGDSVLLRDRSSCSRRWRALYPLPSDRTGHWSDEEERLLQEAISEQLEGKYQVAVDVLVGKPAITRHNLGAWRPALVQLQGQEGLPILKLGSRRLRMLSWLAVAVKVKSRTEDNCRQHFYGVYHNAARGGWTKQEHTLVKEGLDMHGKDYWKIAEHIGTRSPAQVAYMVHHIYKKRKVAETASSGNK
ncbi:hypothetical protein EC991_005318 [Linnemannia zychae]|nr:hypothetical protein EC991_005318 [Linnemannia zychae]